jgi:hypothetical protein
LKEGSEAHGNVSVMCERMVEREVFAGGGRRKIL